MVKLKIKWSFDGNCFIKSNEKLCSFLLFFEEKNNLNNFVTEHIRVNYMQREIYVKKL